jgi:hypothetical protein
MNDRIRQLAEQAFNKANDGTIADIKIPKEFIDEFAQLIVQECAGLVDHVIMEDGNSRGDFIRKHFGVAE